MKRYQVWITYMDASKSAHDYQHLGHAKRYADQLSDKANVKHCRIYALEIGRTPNLVYQIAGAGIYSLEVTA